MSHFFSPCVQFPAKHSANKWLEFSNYLLNKTKALTSNSNCSKWVKYQNKMVELIAEVLAIAARSGYNQP